MHFGHVGGSALMLPRPRHCQHFSQAHGTSQSSFAFGLLIPQILAS